MFFSKPSKSRTALMSFRKTLLPFLVRHHAILGLNHKKSLCVPWYSMHVCRSICSSMVIPTDVFSPARGCNKCMLKPRSFTQSPLNICGKLTKSTFDIYHCYFCLFCLFCYFVVVAFDCFYFVIVYHRKLLPLLSSHGIGIVRCEFATNNFAA